MDCMGNDMNENGVSNSAPVDRTRWNRTHTAPITNNMVQGQEDDESSMLVQFVIYPDFVLNFIALNLNIISN